MIYIYIFDAIWICVEITTYGSSYFIISHSEIANFLFIFLRNQIFLDAWKCNASDSLHIELHSYYLQFKAEGLSTWQQQINSENPLLIAHGWGMPHNLHFTEPRSEEQNQRRLEPLAGDTRAVAWSERQGAQLGGGKRPNVEATE